MDITSIANPDGRWELEAFMSEYSSEVCGASQQIATPVEDIIECIWSTIDM